MRRLNWNLRTTLSEKPIPFWSDDLCAYIIAYYNNAYYIYETYHNAYLFTSFKVLSEKKPECFERYALIKKFKNLTQAKKAVRTIENNKAV